MIRNSVPQRETYIESKPELLFKNKYLNTKWTFNINCVHYIRNHDLKGILTREKNRNLIKSCKIEKSSAPDTDFAIDNTHCTRPLRL